MADSPVRRYQKGGRLNHIMAQCALALVKFAGFSLDWLGNVMSSRRGAVKFTAAIGRSPTSSACFATGRAQLKRRQPLERAQRESTSR